MKHIILFLALLLLSGCMATAGVNIPDQDIVIGVKTDLGFAVVGIPRGYLNPDQENKSWFTLDNYRANVERLKKEKSF